MTIGNKDLFVGFLKIGMMGFGGVAPVARHVIVEDRRWMDDKEYAALLGFGQLLPGANVTNMAILLGMRHGGFLGVLAAMGGMLAVPLLVLMAVSTAYSHAASHPVVGHALASMASVAGGVLIGTGLKTARKAKLDRLGIAFAGLGFVAVAGFHLPMIWVLLSLLPFSVALAWRRHKRS